MLITGLGYRRLLPERPDSRNPRRFLLLLPLWLLPSLLLLALTPRPRPAG